MQPAGRMKMRAAVSRAGSACALGWLAFFLGVSGPAGAAASPPAAPWNAAGKLQVPFVENRGQIPDERVRFYARTFGGTVYVLRSGEVVYALPGAGPNAECGMRSAECGVRNAECGVRNAECGMRIAECGVRNAECGVRSAECGVRSAECGVRSAECGMRNAESGAVTPRSALNTPHLSTLAILTESFGAGPGPAPAGGRRVDTRVNSFLGNDSTRWRTDLPAYETVSLGEIGAGISLELKAHGNSVEKIFTVAPGADPLQIRVALAGAESLAVNARGELEVGTALGVARFSAPTAWQTDAAGRELPVAVAYAVEDDAFGFALGAYDPGQTLMIDPLLASTFVGGRGEDQALAMALESGSGNIIVAGYTASANFPVTNAWSSTLSGGQDVFVSKFDFHLTNLLVSTYLGGVSNDVATALALDAAGNVFLAGYTASSNFPAAINSYFGKQDGFVAKLNSDLSLLTSYYLGGGGTDAVNALAISAAGAVFAAGYTESSDFPMGSGSGYTNVYRGAGDGFVAQFDNSLGLTVSTFLGGAGQDGINALALGGAGDVYAAGFTYSPNFPVVGAYRSTPVGDCDAFVSRFPATLASLDASTYLGGTAQDRALALVLDSVTNIYVGGFSYSTNFIPSMPVPTAQSTNRGGSDAFIVSLDYALAMRNGGTYLGGISNDAIRGLALGIQTVITEDGATNVTTNIVMVGYTASTNFPVTRNAYDTTYNGGTDAFASVMASPLTNYFQAVTYLGGVNNDQAWAVAMAPDSNSVIIVGATASGNFPVSDTAFSTRNSGGTNNTQDGFITRLAASLTYGTLKWEFVADGSVYSSPGMGPDGTIYFGSSTGGLQAVNSDGTAQWSYPFLVGTDTGPIHASPAVGTNDLVYMGGKSGYFYAFDSVSKTLNNSMAMAEGTVCPALDDVGSVYFGTGFGSPLRFIRLHPTTLAIERTFFTGDQIASSSAALGTNHDVYVGTDTGNRAYCLNTTNGVTNGLVSDGLANFNSSPAIGANGYVFFGSCVSNKLYQVNATGTIVRAWALDGPVSSPAIDTNGFVYVGTSNGMFYKINPADGATQRVWSGLGSIASAPAIGVDGSVYVSAGTNLYSLNANPDATLTTNWVFSLNYLAKASSPLVGMDGTIYVGSGLDKRLYAVYGPTPLDLNAPWPRFHHDMMNAGRLAFDHRPLAPADFTASDKLYPDRIQLDWGAVPHATAYEIYRSLGSDSNSADKIASTWRTNYADNIDVKEFTDYNYWIKTKAPLGNSVFSGMRKGRLGSMPLQPTGLSATRGTTIYTNSIRLTWNASLSADSYNIYRGTNAGTPDLIEPSCPTNGYTNTDVILGLKYYYRVSASNAYGASEKSASAYGGTPPLPPATVSATKGVSTPYVSAAWPASTGAAPMRYILYFNTEPSPGGVMATNTDGTSFAHYGLTPCRWYYYWLQASNEFGIRGDYSASDYGWRVLAPPVSVSAGTNGSINILVSWRVGDTNYTTGHYIYRSLTDNTNGATLQASPPYPETETTYTDQVIVRGQRYYYWIQAHNGYGDSVWSAPSAAGSTPPAPPATINATDGLYTNKVRVNWTGASPLATTHHVYRGPDSNPNNASVLIILGSSVIYYDDTSAVPAVSYYYWVRSANAYGVGLFSVSNSGWRAKTPPPPPTPPDPPVSVTASDGTSSSYVAVAWSSVSNAVAYEVWRNTGPNSSTAAKLTYDVTATAYLDASADVGTVYYYWVKSKTDALTSAFSGYDSGYRAGNPVDIGVSDFIVLPTVLAAGSYPDAVSFRIANYGPQALTAPDNAWVLSEFYISANPVFGDADDVLFGVFSNSIPLGVRTSAEVILSAANRAALVLPNLPLGSYYVFVHIRHCLPSAWWDPVPGNNTAMRLGQTVRIGETKSATTVLNDFDGDGRSDLAVYHEPDGNWYIRTVEGKRILYGVSWGAPGYQPVVGDFDERGVSDLAVYSADTGYWFIRSVSGSVLAWYQAWGAPGHQAVPGDYDGDGRSDLAVYSETTGLWYVENLAEDLIAWAVAWGAPGYQAVPGDYDGDGQADFAIYHQTDGYWYIRSVAGGTIAWATWWGGAGYRAVPGDYDGDGVSDLAVYHEYGYWFIQTLAGKLIAWADYWGAPGYQAAPGDYDGDGIYDLAVYSEDSGLWYIRTLAGARLLYGESWGAPGYQPAGGE